MTRGIDNIKKGRGEATTNISDLRMIPARENKGPTPPVTLKLK
jgi:hypothetical protein